LFLNGNKEKDVGIWKENKNLIFGQLIGYDSINSLHNSAKRNHRGYEVVIVVQKSYKPFLTVSE
jgi:hypothetical protein